MCTSGHHLGDRDTLALATRDTSHELVTNEGVGGVFHVEHLEKSGPDLF